MSVAELASAAGLSRTIVARIESGAGNPSVETLFRLARALSVPLAALLGVDAAPPARLIPARSGTHLRADSGMQAFLIHAGETSGHAECYELELPAGTEQRSAGHLSGTEELVLCLSGRLRVGPIGEEVELRAGDAAWFRADREHRYLALRRSRAVNWILSRGRT